MPRVAFVPLTGFRLREQEMLSLGMSLPGLRSRQQAIGQLPPLGLLTMAGMLPDHWSCSWHPVERVTDQLIDELVRESPDIVAISALTASIQEAYELSRRLRAQNLLPIIGGLHATVCPDEVISNGAIAVVGSGELTWMQLLKDVETNSTRLRYEASGTPAEWPQPRFELLGHRPPRFTFQTQRGCPFVCDFCGASRLLGRFAEKPLDNIRAELAAIQKMQRRPLIELAGRSRWRHGPGSS